MKPHKHTVRLSKKERSELSTIIRRGTHRARTITRARVLLLSDEGKGKDTIASTLGMDQGTVRTIRNRYREGGLDRALFDAPRSGKPGKVTETIEAHVVALACTDPPTGRERWTLELLQAHLQKDKKVTLSTVSIWRHLTDRDIQPWREKNVVHSRDNR